MSNVIVIGTQWGDEGKGKIVDRLSEKADLEEAAKNLYAAMHRLDKLKLDAIIIEKLPDTGLGKSINDRLERASKK